jgi:hypothetical protein
MFLKDVESWPERGQIVPFLREKRPRKKCTPNIGADIGAITGILLRSLDTFPSRTNTLSRFYVVHHRNWDWISP